MEQVISHRADGEPGYRVTRGGLEQLWNLVSADRLEDGERISLCLALSELERLRAPGHCRPRSG